MMKNQSPQSIAAFKKYVIIAADSISSLRKVDVHRVLESVMPGNVDGITRSDMASYIEAQRPDLATEVREVMHYEFPDDQWKSGTAQAGTSCSDYIERIDGGRNRVLVYHRKDSDSTFVIPPGVSEREFLAQEAAKAKQEAAALIEKAQQLTSRAKHAEAAAALCDQPTKITTVARN